MELRDKVAKVIESTACLGNYGINNAWEVADAAIATVQEAEADTITTLRAEVAALREGLSALHSRLDEFLTVGSDAYGNQVIWDRLRAEQENARALLETNHAKERGL